MLMTNSGDVLLVLAICIVNKAVSSTFRVLVEMSDVLSGVTAHPLCADLLAHHCSGGDSRCAAIFFLHESIDVSVDLSKDKWGIILEEELALLDGPYRDGATAVHP